MDGNRLKIRQLVETFDRVNIELALTIAEGLDKYHWIEEDYIEVAEWIQPLLSYAPNSVPSQAEMVDDAALIESLSFMNTLMFQHIQSRPPERFFNFIKPKKIGFENVKAKVIPDYVFQCKHLTNLFFLACDFEELPSAIGELCQLRHLGLANNQFQTLPEELGDLKALRYLNCQDNDLSSLPDTLAELSKLYTLDCDNNPFTEVPKVLFEMPQLYELWIKGTAIPKAELEALKAALPSRCRISWTHVESDKLPF